MELHGKPLPVLSNFQYMKYTITNNLSGTYFNPRTNQRVNVSEFQYGKNYENLAAFITDIGLVEFTTYQAREAAFKTAVRNGFDTGLGYKLALTDNDRQEFTGMVTLVQVALSQSLITGETLQTIADKDGKPHTLTTSAFIALMLAYGNYYKQAWNARKGV